MGNMQILRVPKEIVVYFTLPISYIHLEAECVMSVINVYLPHVKQKWMCICGVKVLLLLFMKQYVTSFELLKL